MKGSPKKKQRSLPNIINHVPRARLIAPVVKRVLMVKFGKAVVLKVARKVDVKVARVVMVKMGRTAMSEILLLSRRKCRAYG